MTDKLPVGFAPVEREARDCAVWALAIAARVAYTTVHQWAERVGRKDNHGTSGHQLRGLVRQARLAGVPIRKMTFKRCRLGTFAKKWPSGRYLINVPGHLLPMIDGRHDGTSSDTRIVTHAWRIDNRLFNLKGD